MLNKVEIQMILFVNRTWGNAVNIIGGGRAYSAVGQRFGLRA